VWGLGYGPDDREVAVGISAGQEIAIVCRALKLALEITQRLSQRVLRTAFEQDQGPARKLSTNLYDTYHC